MDNDVEVIFEVKQQSSNYCYLQLLRKSRPCPKSRCLVRCSMSSGYA